MAILQQMVIQPTPLGENFLAAADITGPATYSQTTGQVISAKAFALLSIRFADGMASRSGTYFVRAISPPSTGASSVTVHWFISASALEVSNGTGLTGETVRMIAIGN